MAKRKGDSKKKRPKQVNEKLPNPGNHSKRRRQKSYGGHKR